MAETKLGYRKGSRDAPGAALPRLRVVRGFRFPGMRKEGEGLPTTHQETKCVLLTQRKIPIGRNRYACQSNLICSNYAINNFQTEC